MPSHEVVTLVWHWLLLPVLMTAAGWVIVRVATWLVFHPRHFSGPARPLGWQGWLARRPAQLMTHLLNTLDYSFKPLTQVFEHLTPQKWVTHAVRVIRPRLDIIIDDAISSHNSVLWENMPVTLKNRFYERAHRQIPAVIDDVIEEFGDQADGMVDLPHLLTLANESSPYLATRMMEHAATPWLLAARDRFAGLLLAMLMAVMMLVQDEPWWWTAIGLWCSFAVAFWLRHKTIWDEVIASDASGEDTRSRQHAARQARLSQALSGIIADEIMTPRLWMAAAIEGCHARQTRMLVKKHVVRLVENLPVRTFAQMAIGATGYVELKQGLSNTVLAALRTPFEDLRFNQARAERVRHLFAKRLDTLSGNQVTRLVAPAVNAQAVLALLLALPASIAAAWLMHA